MIKKYPITVLTPLIFFAFSFLTYTVFKFVGLGLLFCCFFMMLLFFKNNIILHHVDLNVIYLFYLLPFASLGITLFSVFICGMPYIELYTEKIGRMVNASIFLVVFVFVTHLKNSSQIKTDDIINWYLYGCCILIFFGLWQIGSFLFHIPYPDLGTRTFFHSMDESALPSFVKGRVTSIADEPAYLVTYLLDAGIITFYKNKSKLLLCAVIIVLFFTLSLSGYVNLFAVTGIIYLLSKNTKRKMLISVFLFIGLAFLISQVAPVFKVVLERLELKSLLRSSRLQDSILTLKYMANEASLYNVLFGFGPKGMGYIRQFLFYPFGHLPGEIVGNTTHVVWIDYLVDYGILGVILLAVFFREVYKMAVKTFRKTGNRLAQVLCLNWLISGLYSPEYASPRFTILLLIIMFLYKDSRQVNYV